MRMRAVLGGFALAFTPGFNVANVGAVADQVAHAYGIGLAVVGLFTTGLFVTHAALQVPMGRLCDRFGARVVGGTGPRDRRVRVGGSARLEGGVVRDRHAPRRRRRHRCVVRRRR